MADESLSPFKMNIPTDLKGRIEAAAKKNRRSISGEIIATLEDKYPVPPDGITYSDVRSLITEMTGSIPPENQTRALARVDRWFARKGLNIHTFVTVDEQTGNTFLRFKNLNAPRPDTSDD